MCFVPLLRNVWCFYCVISIQLIELFALISRSQVSACCPAVWRKCNRRGRGDMGLPHWNSHTRPRTFRSIEGKLHFYNDQCFCCLLINTNDFSLYILLCCAVFLLAICCLFICLCCDHLVVVAAKSWTITIPEAERNRLGPLDALRLDISEGNNTAFYGLNADGWILHNEAVKYSDA